MKKQTHIVTYVMAVALSVCITGELLAVDPPRLLTTQMSVEQLIQDLNAANDRAREDATQALMNHGPTIYPALRQAFVHTDSHEVRRRIKRIAREIYLTESLGPAPAFLGVSLRAGGAVNAFLDGRVPPDASALLITSVFRCSSADRAGLKKGDLWLSFDGLRATGMTDASEFVQRVFTRAPGTQCRLGVLRGGEGRYLNRLDYPGFDPRAFSKVGFRVVTHAEDARLVEGQAGIVLTDVRRADPRLRLKKGDLIQSLNGHLLPPNGAEALFRRWATGEPIAAEEFRTEEDNSAENKDNKRRRPRGPVAAHGDHPLRSSAQILRGGEYLELNVVLGRTPSNLNDRRHMRYDMRAAPLRDARAGFEGWWQSWAPTSKHAADASDARAYWLLEP